MGPEKLENITPNFLQSQLPFLPRSGRGREPCYCHVAARATGRAGQWERAGLGSTAPRLRRTGTWRSAARRRRKSFFCRQEGPRCADAAPTATLPQLAVVFVFLVAAREHERALLPGLRKKGLTCERDGGRAPAAPSAGIHYRLEVGAGPRVSAACGDPGRARSCGTTMGAPRVRALAAALGLLLCEVLGHAGPAEGGGLEALGPPSGVGAEHQCPTPCRCFGDLLDCSRQRLAHLPEPLPSWIARL